MEHSGLTSQLSYEQQRAFRQSELLFDDDRAEKRRQATEYEKKHYNQMILREFFSRPMDENAIKRVQGNHLPVFNEHLQGIYQRLQEFDPQLGADCFASPPYRSLKTKEVMAGYSFREKDELHGILRTYRRGLREVANEIASKTSRFTIGRGQLAIPSYYAQQNGQEGMRECFNACFRMVFNDLTDLDITQDEVRVAMNMTGNVGVVDDQEYLKVFTDPGFRELSSHACKVVNFLGADLGVIDKTVRAIRAKQPGAKVYSIASMLSETGTRDSDHLIWHTGVLLYADEERVVLHDPKESGGRRGRNLGKDEFLRRWGMAFNSVYLVIAAQR